jgi:acetoin utilization deacetylase AcuC-like enzyme
LRAGPRNHALRVPRGQDAEAGFVDAINQALDIILQLRPDLVLYQAGADMHVDDPKATLRLSSQALERRDQRIFSALKAAGIPVLCSLAGGYQSAASTAEIYQRTVHSACTVFAS